MISVLHLRRVRGARPTKRVWVFHGLHQSAATLCRWHCPRLTMLPREVFSAALLGDITAVKAWLAEGGNPNEAWIEEDIDDDSSLSSIGEDNRPPSTLLMAAASEGHLDLVRRLALLRVRSLLARGRARHGPETTVVAARLFDTSTAAGVPKECFWLVVKYAWLGDWRRP